MIATLLGPSKYLGQAVKQFDFVFEPHIGTVHTQQVCVTSLPGLLGVQLVAPTATVPPPL
jgi:hypothetical protein